MTEADAEFRTALSAARWTPKSCGNGPGKNRRTRPERRPGDQNTRDSYRRATNRVCDRAFPPPGPVAKREDETVANWRKRLTKEQRRQLASWRKANRWHPHQLRHNAATDVREECGLEDARIILGHRSAAITEVYAEEDEQAGIRAIMKVG